jgi:hypothetical protein
VFKRVFPGTETVYFGGETRLAMGRDSRLLSDSTRFPQKKRKKAQKLGLHLAINPKPDVAAPVHDGGQARAVAQRNGAGSLPGRRPVFPLQNVKERAPGRLSQRHNTIYQWEYK